MAPSDLGCVYCGRTAFAVLNLEITKGRARFPTCTGLACIQRATNEARQALQRAAGQHSDVIDVDGYDAPTQSVLTVAEIAELGHLEH